MSDQREEDVGETLLEENGAGPSQVVAPNKSGRPDSVTSQDLQIDVKDLINIRSFKKAQSVKPIKRTAQTPDDDYTKLMPYCQVSCLVSVILAAVFLALGYSTFKETTKASPFKYAGFACATIAVVTFIAVIYINSVSDENLIDTMRNFRRSRAANPQINKKLTKTNSNNAS